MNYQKIVEVKLPTEKGSYKLIAYQNGDPNKYHLALVRGNVKNQAEVLVRIHSSCITGDIFGSLRCDCGPQLEKAMEIIEKAGSGVILYLFQEGRGIGLINKLKAYKLQEQGLDTVEANLALGLPADSREYHVVKDVLDDLKIQSVVLITNNPEKISKLKGLGVKIKKAKNLKAFVNNHNYNYLKTKKLKMGHQINL